MVDRKKVKIAVIGAGLQGSSVALALAKRGYHSTLIEKEHMPMQGASLRNEGKIHLGFIYALDKSGKTRKLMLKGALSFAKLIDSWCGPAPWNEWKSDNFRYANMPSSLLSSDQLEESYSRLSEELSETSDNLNSSKEYFGNKLSWLWKRSDEVIGRPLINGELIADYFETEEVAINPHNLAQYINRSLNQNKKITICCNTNVLGAVRKDNGFLLLTKTGDRVEELNADIVINCAWHDRLRLDHSIDVNLCSDLHSYRIKHQILVKPNKPNNLKAVSLVQGPFGDIVPWQDGLVYISWYPIGRTYFSSLPPPPFFGNSKEALKIASDSLVALSEFFPELQDSTIVSSLPGIIMARGESDVDKIDSDLHERYKVGPENHNGWWSVDTGKLTTAPLFAEQTAQEVEREIG